LIKYFHFCAVAHPKVKFSNLNLRFSGTNFSNLNQQKSKFEVKVPKTKIRILKMLVLLLKFGEFKFAKIGQI